MRKRFLSVLQYVIFLGGGIFLVWWQLRSMTPDEKTDFIQALSYTNYWPILPVAIICLLSHLSRAIRWKLLLETLDYKPSLKNVFAVLMIGYLGNASVPRLGEVLKCTFLAKYEKLQVDKLFGTIVLERTFDLLCFIIFIAATVLIQSDLIGDYFRGKIALIGQSTGMPIWAKLLIVASFLLIAFLLLRYLFKRYPKNIVILKVNKFISGLIQGFKTIKHLKKRKLFLFHTLVIWTFYLLQVYIGFSAMESTAHLGLKAAASVLTLATIAMIVTPGGIGSFPIFVTETLLIYGILYPAGNAFGWLLWGVNTGIVIIAGLLALLLLPIINKKKHAIHTVNTQQNPHA